MTKYLPRACAVGGDHEPAARVREPGREGRRLAEVPAKPDHAHPRIARLQCRELLERVVGAPIVDDQQLVAAPVLAQGLGQLFIQLFDVGRLVVYGDDDREFWTHQLLDIQGII